MTQTYEGMFLLDNQAVRADWGRAKGAVTDMLTKHGARVVSARRWDERALVYPIRGRRRATYLLSYFEQDGQGQKTMRRDLDIEERVLRYLILSADGVPEAEIELSQAELAEGFSVPPPPEDDAPPPPPAEASAAAASEDARPESAEDESGDADESDEPDADEEED